MPGEFGFRPKEMDELESQFAGANTILDPEKELLRPPSIEREKILSMPEAEIKEKFPRRYEMYCRLVKELRYQGIDEETEELVTLSKSDVEHMRKWLIALNSLDEYIQNHYENEEERTLRGRQINVFEDLRNFLEQGGTAGYVKLPTGVGKTVLFTELIEALNLRTLIVVPTKILVKQTDQKIKQFAPDLDVGKVYQYAKEYSRQITITTYNSLIAKVESGEIKPEDFDCLILDEAHHALAKGSKGAIGKFTEAVKLGFTATPDFKFEKRLAHLLPKEIHSMSIREAVEGNLLCGVSSVIAKTDADISSVPIDDTGEYSEEQLEKAVNIASRNKAAVQLYKTAYDGQLASAFCVNVEHARIVTKEFNEAGIPAALITGETPKEEQEQILKNWHEGKIKVVSCAKLFIEGLDEKRVSVCLNLKPTRSRISAEQRGGRVLRLDEDNPKKHATVIDFLDKGIREDKPPILFADVVDRAVLIPKLKGGGPGGRPTQPVILDIAGLEVIYDEEEIMRIVQQFRTARDLREKKSGKEDLINNIDKLKAAVRASGIKPGTNLKRSYQEACIKYPNWIKRPESINGFVSWPDLWGVEVRVHRIKRAKGQELIKDLGALKDAIQNSGITPGTNLIDSYNEARLINPWPAHPFQLPGWISWQDLWGKEEKVDSVTRKRKIEGVVDVISDLKILKALIKESGIEPGSNLAKSYRDACHSHLNWPSHPEKLTGYVNWTDLWGVPEKEKRVKREKGTDLIRDIGKLKLAISASGIKPGVNLSESYIIACNTHSDWPVAAHKLSGFTTWADLWGIEKKK